METSQPGCSRNSWHPESNSSRLSRPENSDDDEHDEDKSDLRNVIYKNKNSESSDGSEVDLDLVEICGYEDTTVTTRTEKEYFQMQSSSSSTRKKHGQTINVPESLSDSDSASEFQIDVSKKEHCSNSNNDFQSQSNSRLNLKSKPNGTTENRMGRHVGQNFNTKSKTNRLKRRTRQEPLEGALRHRSKHHPQRTDQFHRKQSPKRIKLSPRSASENISLRRDQGGGSMMTNTLAVSLGIDMNLNINVLPVFGNANRFGSEVESKHKVNGLKRCQQDSAVICLDSDSDSDRKPVIIKTSPEASPEPILIDSGSDHVDPHDDYCDPHDDYSDRDSDSSDPPDIPILEPMNTLYSASAPVHVNVDQPYAQEDCILEDKFYSRQKSEPEAYLEEPEEHCNDEAVTIDVPTCSDEDSGRSRHSSGESGTSFDDPTDACWYSLLSAPEHAKPADQSVRKHLHHHCVSHFFSQDKFNVITGCHEEGFTRAAVELIVKFTTTAHKPFPKCLQDLYHKCLGHSSTFAKASIMYNTLKSIQHFHHPSAQDLPIQWTHIQQLARSLLTTPQCNTDEQFPLKWHIDMLSLCYLVTALEDDLERKARWNTLKKSSAYTLLHPDTCRPHCKELAEWTHTLISGCSGCSEGQASSSQNRRERTCGCPEELCHRIHVLPLFGKLLGLSMRLTNEWNHKEYMQRIVEQLNSLGLVGLPQIQLMLETLQHELLHLKLSELIFNSHFEPMEVLYDNTIRRESISLGRIVEEYFKYVPRKPHQGDGAGAWQGDGEGSDASCSMEDSGMGERRHHQRWTVDDKVEEMVYLLFIMIKSYLRYSPGTTHPVRTELGKRSASSLVSCAPSRRLNDEDSICLLQIGDYVDRLRAHLQRLVKGQLTTRTRIQLDQMSVLYECLY